MSQKLVEMASQIVQTQASLSPMTAADITSSLRGVFATLHELQRIESGEMESPETTGTPQSQAVTPENSIQADKVVCLECGAQMKQLTKLHLDSHGLTAKEYKKKYGFTFKTPLAAKSLTKARSKAAKKKRITAEPAKVHSGEKTEQIRNDGTTSLGSKS
ncbi:MAG: MucR family transcriptional regulator [Deltaproteobacteria bacterium]|nr:MucR family transcriptional regulator [Deltaproteobacteria bacterium]